LSAIVEKGQLTHVKPIASKLGWLQAKTKVMEKNIYGLLAEFDTPTQLVDAANKVREAGYTKTDAFSPFPLHEIDEALGIKRSILPLLVFGGGITGLLTGFGLQIFVHYIELTILFAAFTAVGGMLLLNGLPQPYHPVFNVPRFALATREKFFLLIETKDSKFNYDETKSFMQSLNPQEVFDVEP
jgi:hypothetical protein